ncbi:MAG TPA: hypothetical protein VI455_11225 [Terriglobia bacterium]
MTFKMGLLGRLVAAGGTIFLTMCLMAFAQSSQQPSAAAAPAQSPATLQGAPSSGTQTGASPSAQQAAPAAEPASPAAAQPPTAVAMEPAQAQALIYKVYTATFRVGDLASTLQPDQWKLDDQQQAAFAQKLASLRAALAAVEKPRAEFYNHPADLELGHATLSALQALSLPLDDFIKTLADSPGAAAAKDFQQAAGDLADLRHQIEAYVAYLEAKIQPPAGGGPALQTEQVTEPAAAAPITVQAAEKPPLSQEELKALLYKAYTPSFRMRDLLQQEHPENWRASDAERSSYRDASEALTGSLADLAKWRDQLADHPESLEAAFEVYASLGKVVEPADAVGHQVAQYDDPKTGAEYLERAQQVAGVRTQLEPYLDYLLSYHDRSVGTVERDFVSCEKELSSTMGLATPAAASMNNILPAFKGRGKTLVRGESSKSKSAHSHVKKASETAAPPKTP